MHWLRNLNRVRVFIQNGLAHRRKAAGPAEKKRVLHYDMWTLRVNKIRNWDDDSGATDGTVQGAQPSEEGRPPGSYYFDRNDFVTIPAFPLVGTALTFCVWGRCSNYATRNQTFIGDGGFSATVGYIRMHRLMDTPDLCWEFADGEAAMRERAPDFFVGYEDAWVHIVVVCDYVAKTCAFYRNGIPYAAYDMSGTPDFPDTSRLRYLGVYNAEKAEGLRIGYIDEPQLWEGALTDEEVLAVYDEYEGQF